MAGVPEVAASLLPGLVALDFPMGALWLAAALTAPGPARTMQ